MLRFSNRTAIITGASRGIGLAIARALVADGARVVVTGRNQAALDEAVASLGGPSVALGLAGHADDAEHQAQVVGRAISHFGSADFLVNNTGINPAYGPLMQMDLSVARRIVDVNCIATLSWAQQVHQNWMATHGGAIVNIASAAGIRPAPGIAFYGASKAMLIHLTQELAHELAPRVRVNAVAPAVVKTKFAAALYEGREDEMAAGYPLGRLGIPNDVATVVSFLLGEESGWMTGQTLLVDGGALLNGGAA